MDGNEVDKKYKSMKIPNRQQAVQVEEDKTLPRSEQDKSASLKGMFYEIEYDTYPIKGVGKFVLKPQKIKPQKKDEVRELFYSMRDIKRDHRTNVGYTQFFDRRVQQDNASVFYKQGIFMKDFTDTYSGDSPFSSYFPDYQMMGYEQLRTYFTWRTEVRCGNVSETSLSYAFLYIYELLNNIGVENPQEGLDKLISFWNTFRYYNKTVDKYVIRWLKDYYIYYDLPYSFKEFVQGNNLVEYYPKTADTDDKFELFCTISKYDIRESAFFTDDNKKFIKDCFNHVINKLRRVLSTNDMHLEDSIFSPTKKMSAWQPFKDALFHPWLKQQDRRVVLSENEIYICNQNKWEFNTAITTESGKRLVGYIMKQMESVLRPILKYKFKLSANINTVNHIIIDFLSDLGLSLSNIVTDAVMEFYRESTKVVISVDQVALVKIRQDALSTQEKLIVEEQEVQVLPSPPPLASDISKLCDEPVFESPAHEEFVLVSDPWANLKQALSETEIEALRILISGGAGIKQLADSNSIMLEVLIDGINEKAMDFIGDNLLDDELTIYDEYIGNIKEL